VLAMVGKGGFGAVYKAADMQFGNRLLAIKEMSQSNLSPQELAEVTEAFKREALLLAGLTHPNLPRIYEQFSDAGRWYLVMDFIEGETLEDTLDKAGGKLPVEKVLDIGIQLSSVLDYLHHRQPPIIFRDLKPANVMLAHNGHIYLIDFGIARHFKLGQSKDTTALGSTGYAAPEQYGRAQTTPRADIYSLGATLHEMLSGNDPADSPFHFAPLQLRNTPVLASLETLIMQMLEIDVSKRPASAAFVMESLRRIAALHGGAQTNPLQATLPPGYQPLPTMPPIVRTTGPQASPAQPPKPVAKIPKPQRPQPAKPINLLFSCTGHSSRATSVAWSRNGSRIVSGSFDKTVRVWNAADGNSIQTYLGHADRVQAVAWAPDSMHVASAGDDRTVHIWHASTGALQRIYSGHADHVLGLAWSPDGTRIASASADKTVQVWDAATGRNIFTYRGHTDYVFAVAWSPDGKRIATGGNDKVVQVWELTKDTKGNFITSFLFSKQGSFAYRGHNGRINAIAWSPDGRRIASVGSDKSLQIWDASSGKLAFIYRHRSSAFNVVAWSFDNRRIATGNNDKTVQVWDTQTRSTLCIYSGHTGYVNGVAWSPEGTRIASASVDKTVQVWRPT
jgi:WD40 repeat protein